MRAAAVAVSVTSRVELPRIGTKSRYNGREQPLHETNSQRLHLNCPGVALWARNLQDQNAVI